MNSLYLILDLATFAVPLLLSFDKRVAYYKRWKWIFPGIALMGLIFLSWDVVFAARGVWGFNDDYLIGVRMLGLPLEEWLFFLVVPYSCLFIYESLRAWFPAFNPLAGTSRWIALVLGLILLVLIGLHPDRIYTVVNFSLGSAILLFMAWSNPKWGGRFWMAFFIALAPFFVMNGILTGSFLPEPIVWYSAEGIMGPRMWTIPVEDTIYAFSMLWIPTVVLEFFRLRAGSRAKSGAPESSQIPLTS